MKKIIKVILSVFFGTKKQKHDFAGWGYPTGLKEKDQYGFQDVYSCKFCNRELAQDSTGVYFHLSS